MAGEPIRMFIRLLTDLVFKPAAWRAIFRGLEVPDGVTGTVALVERPNMNRF